MQRIGSWESVSTYEVARPPSHIRLLVILRRVKLAPRSQELVITTPWCPNYLRHRGREGANVKARSVPHLT